MAVAVHWGEDEAIVQTQPYSTSKSNQINLPNISSKVDLYCSAIRSKKDEILDATDKGM